MEIPWFIIFITLCLSFAFKSFINLIQKRKPKLPPGPSTIPVISTLRFLRRSFVSQLESTLRSMRSKYGPILTIAVGNRKAIFISSHDLAHQALVQNGATFADRPPAPETNRILNSNEHSVNTARYGPLWRLLRRNLSSEILHASRIRSYAHARSWVLKILKNKLKSGSFESGQQRPILLKDDFQYAMFCLLVFMCFGEKYDEDVVKQIEKVQRDLIVNLNGFSSLNLLPISLSKILYRNGWRKIFELGRNRENVLLPLIRARRDKIINNKKEEEEEQEESFSVAYVDTLFNITLPKDHGDRKLSEEELVTLCSEFLIAGTDTTSTALEWIMANLVKNQEIQNKLYNEIKEVINDDVEIIKEEELQKLLYLKAVVLEGLRRHPPAHFLAPHAVTEEILLGGYVIPKDAVVNFMVAEMGWDPKVWDDPMEFKPERFLSLNKGGARDHHHQGEVSFDITGSREIKMMPFGAGRRICPGLSLAMLHLEYFVANLVKEFKWTAREGDEVDLSEMQELMVVMKYPLWAHISPRT